jgi:alkylation response protein AidB-like acyl-CoA dehydrogenase
MKRLIFEPEHEQFRDSVRRFFLEEVAPNARRWREQGYVDREIYLRAGANGYLLPWAEEIYGGLGIKDFRYEQIIAEENVRHGEIGFYISLHSGLVGPYIGKLGNAEQKARLLPGCISGEKILAVAMTEPDTGSDLAGMRTQAVDKGDHWLLNGTKTYISNGQLADIVIVAARTGAESHSLGLFIVEAGMPGFERGKRLHKMGMDAQDTSELFFNDVRVPKENLIGEPDQGFRYLGQLLAGERLIAAVLSMSAAQTAFDLSLDYAKQRKAFGRAIGLFQHWRFVLAELRTEIDCAQTFIDQCVLLYNAGELDAMTGAQVKLLATELEGRVVDAGVQIHGGAGYMEEYPISRLYRNARISRIFAGTSEIMKEIIGRGLGLDERKGVSF